jgi:hypothetical protein
MTSAWSPLTQKKDIRSTRPSKIPSVETRLRPIFDCGTRALVAPEIVHHDKVAPDQRRDEDLIDIGLEPDAVDRAVEDHGRGRPGQTQACASGFPIWAPRRRVTPDRCLQMAKQISSKLACSRRAAHRDSTSPQSFQSNAPHQRRFSLAKQEYQPVKASRQSLPASVSSSAISSYFCCPETYIKVD